VTPGRWHHIGLTAEEKQSHNRHHPRLRGTAMACLMLALVFMISYAATLLA